MYSWARNELVSGQDDQMAWRPSLGPYMEYYFSVTNCTCYSMYVHIVHVFESLFIFSFLIIYC